MTNETNPGTVRRYNNKAKAAMLPAAQIDREAAAVSYEMDGVGPNTKLLKDVRAGICDHFSRVQIFARHRLDVLASDEAAQSKASTHEQ